MTDISTILHDAGYTRTYRNEAGVRYSKAGFTVYHSGGVLIFMREGGMTRPFLEDTLQHYSIADLERRTSVDFKHPVGKENYDYPNKRRY